MGSGYSDILGRLILRDPSQQERTWDGEEVEGRDPGREEVGQAAMKGAFGEGGVLGGLAGEERLVKV